MFQTGAVPNLLQQMPVNQAYAPSRDNPVGVCPFWKVDVAMVDSVVSMLILGYPS
jgi:hypothetical protein